MGREEEEEEASARRLAGPGKEKGEGPDPGEPPCDEEAWWWPLMPLLPPLRLVVE